MSPSKPSLPEGNELYREITLPDGSAFPVTYWNLWFALALRNQFAGDWEAMLAQFRKETSALSWRRDEAEGVLNHATCLRQALADAVLAPDDLLQGLEPDFQKKHLAKAKRKLMELGISETEKSAWMAETPRRMRKFRAYRGYWDHFPVSPYLFAQDIAAIFRTGRYHLEDETFKLNRKLEKFLKDEKSRIGLPGQLGLYRSFLTVILENMGGVDDSFGLMGDLYERIFESYYLLDRSQVEIASEIYVQDLVELLIWEDHSFTYRNQPEFFASLSEPEIPIAESILKQQWHELSELGLDYQSEKALTMLGLLYAQKAMFDRFTPAAKAMGTRAWKRITLLAEAAEKHQHYDLAVGVYEACMGPGMHHDYLHKEFEKLKRRLAGG